MSDFLKLRRVMTRAMTDAGSARRLHGPESIRALLVLLFLPFVVLGCDVIGVSDDESPETAVVELEQGSEGGALRLVTSTDFIRSRTGGSPEVLSADTIGVSTPFERGFDIRDAGRFYAEASSPDSSQTTITMRVRIGDAEHFNTTQTVTHETIRFVFVFRSFGP